MTFSQPINGVEIYVASLQGDKVSTRITPYPRGPSENVVARIVGDDNIETRPFPKSSRM